MSIFDYPRINFKGTIQLNPGTANNDDAGLCCKNYFQAGKSYEVISLCRYSEQRSNKLRLPLRITSG